MVAHFRFDPFARALLVIGPAWVVTLVVSDYLVPERQTNLSLTDVLWLLAITLVLTPARATT